MNDSIELARMICDSSHPDEAAEAALKVILAFLESSAPDQSRAPSDPPAPA